jgi:GNAT superfamily N-acetyltransferase
MTEIAVTHLHDEYLDDVVALIIAQQSRQHALDPRLPAARPRQEITAALAIRHGSGEQPLVVLDANGRVRGYAKPGIWELSETSILRAFLSARNGVAQHLTLPDPAEEDAPVVAAALLTALSDIWQRLDTTGDLVRWPSTDSWLEPRLAEQGFRLDSVCATRSLQPLPEVLHAPSPQLVIRPVRPADEEVLIVLFEEELRYHERYTPFVRSSPAVLAAFRGKLARLWAGASLEAGAPLILAVEQAGEIVAMAENTLLVLGPDDQPGFTPPGRYGCIDNVCVREALRGQGIGRLLVQAIFDAFAATGLQLDGYLLWYNPDNPQAGQFWSHLGFRPLWTTYQRLHPAHGSTEGA